MDIAKLIESLASLAWPVIAAVLLWYLFPIVREIARSRAFTVKVGEMEVSVQEASEQLRQQIEDLQKKVSELRTRQTLGASPEESLKFQPEALREAAPQPTDTSPSPQVLWVDDKPAGNAYEIARLRDAGVEVSEVTTTDEALRLLTGGSQFNAIITDMGRREGLSFRSQAGLDLIRAARAARVSSPIFVYATRKRVERTRDEVMLAGGNGATASTVELFEMLRGALGIAV